ASLVAEREREQEEADRRRGDRDRAAEMGHQPAQGDDLRTERGKALDEHHRIEQRHRQRSPLGGGRRRTGGGWVHAGETPATATAPSLLRYAGIAESMSNMQRGSIA